MPIDFNPNINNIYFKSNTENVRISRNYYIQPSIDTFTKSITAKSMDTSFDSIRISQKPFGKIQKNGEQAILYTITNKNGASVDLSTFGATITSIKIKDKNDNIKDITQGYDTVTPYETSPIGHAGGTIGPCANKINNGEFTLDNKTYTLERNKDNGKTHSHGGSNGFDVQNWHAKILPDGVEFSYLKKDNEGGYPGNVSTKVTYKFDNNNRLHIIYDAETDKNTLINLTNHTYFNLDGEENTQENSVYDHIVKLPNSSSYTQNNEISVPTGEILPVKNTPLDFSQAKRIGDDINSDFDQIQIGSGFDQNYVVDNYDGKTLIDVAEIKSPKTGIKLTVSTDLPGFQFYSANHLGKKAQPNGKSGKRYEKRSSFCVEPQFFPNAINTKEFIHKPILKPNEKYHKQIVYSFDTEK